MNRARLALGLVGAVAIVEVAAAAMSYRARVRSEDWEAARIAIDALPAEEPVWIASEWIGPRARMALPRLASIDAAARPDLRGASRFAVLGVDAAWSPELQLAL